MALSQRLSILSKGNVFKVMPRDKTEGILNAMRTQTEEGKRLWVEMFSVSSWCIKNWPEMVLEGLRKFPN